MATFLRTRATLTLPGISTPPLLTYYWDSTGATTTALVTEAHARVRAFHNSLAAFYPTNTGLVINAVADEIEETTGEIVGQVTGTLPAGVAFSGTTDLLPLQTQGLLRLQTGTFRFGRRLAGRQYVPYRAEGQNDSGGLPTSAYISAVNTAAALLGTTVVTAMNQRVWSRPQPGRAGLSAVVIARASASTWSVLKSRRS